MIFSLQQHKKAYVLTGVFVIIVLGLVTSLIYPIFKGIQHGARDMVLARGEVLLATEQQQSLAHFNAAYANYEPNLHSLERSFVDTANPIDFIAFLEDTAAVTNTGIDIALSIPKQGQENVSGVIACQISLEGEFEGIASFIALAERGPYLLSLQKVAIQHVVADDVKKAARSSANILMQVITK